MQVYLGLNLDTGELLAVKQVELGVLGLGITKGDIAQNEEVRSLILVRRFFSPLVCRLAFIVVAVLISGFLGNRFVEDAHQ